MSEEKKCRQCNGFGLIVIGVARSWDDPTSTQKCPRCEGSGVEPEIVDCPYCQGAGVIAAGAWTTMSEATTCPKCNGLKQVTKAQAEKLLKEEKVNQIYPKNLGGAW